MSVVTEFVSSLKGHKWQISCLEFKSGANTVYLASGSWDKQVRIWDLSRIDSSTKLKGVHDGAVTSLAWCEKPKDSHILATASADNTACLWDWTTGKNLARFVGHTGWVLDCSFSCDGRTLATSSWDTNVKLWDVETKKCVRSLEDHESGVWTCKYHPENPYIVCTGSEDGSLRVWDDRSTTSTYFGGHDDSVRCCSWSSSGGEYLVSGCADSTIILWDFRQNVSLSKCCGHEAIVADVKFFPLMGEKRYPFLLSCGDYTVRMWHPFQARHKELFKLRQHNFGAEVETIAISEDGTLLASGGLDNQIVLTAMAVPLPELEDLAVESGSDSWNRPKRERTPSDSLDECDGLPHKGKRDEKLEELNQKKEYLIIPPVSSAAGMLEEALERRDKQINGSASTGDQSSKKPAKTRRKGNKTRQRPRSFVAVNGNSSANSSLNMELKEKIASMKRVKPRADSDPVSTMDLTRTKKDGSLKRESYDQDQEELETITNEMINLAQEMEKGTRL